MTSYNIKFTPKIYNTQSYNTTKIKIQLKSYYHNTINVDKMETETPRRAGGPFWISRYTYDLKAIDSPSTTV